MQGRLLGVLLGALLLGVVVPEARAQYAPPPPPPPPPPATEPAPAPEHGQGLRPAQPPRYRPRRACPKPSPWGRFYFGAGLGYLKPGGELGEALRGHLGYGFMTGWRKGWFGVELAYLGLRPGSDRPDVIFAQADSAPVAAPKTSVMRPGADKASLSHVTLDAKVFLRVFRTVSIFARAGANYAMLKLPYMGGYHGAGYQYGAGFDWRVRLSWRPNWVMKVRAEVVHLQAGLRRRGDDPSARQGLSSLAAMVWLNFGYSAPSRR